MISTFRMQLDSAGQVILISAILILLWFESGLGWTNALLIFLAIWQIMSALHLLFVYQHIKKVNFLKTMTVLLCSLPIWINLVGLYAYIPVGGVLVWYFFQTIMETRIVLRRPRSFWDL